MGCEFGQGNEWNFNTSLDWYVLDYPLHQGIKKLVSDLNHLYRDCPALHQYDFDHNGFEWIDCHDSQQSVISFLRKSGDQFVIVILNFTPVPRHDYRIGVPRAGTYCELFNSDSEHYSGSNVGNSSELHSEAMPWMNRDNSMKLILPPLGCVVLELIED